MQMLYGAATAYPFHHFYYKHIFHAMKRLLSMVACCLLGASAALLHAQRILKEPTALDCVNVTNGSLKVREVVLADTATTVRFTLDYPAGRDFRIMSTCYLADEHGRRYALRSAEGLTPDVWMLSPDDRITHFTLHFEPMPKRTRQFDFVEGDGQGAFMLLGIHDRKHTLRMKTMEELMQAYGGTAPTEWFRTDSVTLRGRIEGYRAGDDMPQALEGYHQSVFDKESSTMVADICADGTFTKRWKMEYPQEKSFSFSKPLPGLSGFNLYASPGDTLDVVLRRGDDGRYRCDYLSGSSREVERWLRTKLHFNALSARLFHFEGTPSQAQALAEHVWQVMAYRLQTVATREKFTPQEMQLALAAAQVYFATGVMDYAMHKAWKENISAADSLQLDTLGHEAFYSRLLSRIDFNNPLLTAIDRYDILINRLQFALPLYTSRYGGGALDIVDEHGRFTYTADSVLTQQQNYRKVWRGMTGGGKDNLLAQLCGYKEMLSEYGLWHEFENDKNQLLADTTLSEEERTQRAAAVPCLSNVLPRLVASFSHKDLRRLTEAYHALRQKQTGLTLPLPEGQPAALIRSLLARFPGRYLIIDFWGMGCGPCRAAIQSSKALRAEIAKRYDVKLVYIAGEETPEGSEAYRNYVNEWLAGEETICISNLDFSRLQEYFGFNAIPHYETITPNGRIVGEKYRITGLYNLEFEMERMLKALQ